MAASELSLKQIHIYLVEKGGIVANRDVVRHFRQYLTDPQTQDDARAKFKKYINILATTKSEGNEKFLILRPKYTLSSDESVSSTSSQNSHDSRSSLPAPIVPGSPSISISDYSPSSSPGPRQPPPYRAPPPVTPNQSYDNISINSSIISYQDAVTPQAPPRRRSSEKSTGPEMLETPNNSTVGDENGNETLENDKSISVKERMQKFNRMASVDDEVSPRQQKEKNKQPEKGVDEDDGASFVLMDSKRCVEWYVAAAKGEYQDLSKLATNEPRFVKLKDPYTTVLHWGAKHGNVDIIKHFAGKYKCDVNARTNGGYTPLHIAAKFGHDNIYNVLITFYGANENIRDFSGNLPKRYRTLQCKTTTADINKKGRKKLAEKDLGFLRIGSLNVRVKKTTEAFSNFLGVGNAVAINPVDSTNVHKGWGSADNVTQENLLKGNKRKMKRPLETSGTNSTPGTPNHYPRAISQRNFAQDSDSDTAAGFDSNWKN